MEAAMKRLIRSNLVIVVAVALLALFASVGAFASPDVTPWPDPFEASGEPADLDDDTEVTETLEATETPELEDTELPDDGDSDAQSDVDVEGEGGQGVPLDSPACAGTSEDPNPHDTDGDGDGCREVDGKNLPDPAADAQEGHPGDIADVEHGNGNGPPTGEPPFGHGQGNDDETPTPTPTG
jgi:hypothetical protein